MIAITQFDQSYTPNNDEDDDKGTSEEVQAAICRKIEAAIGEPFSKDRIISVSAQWGLIAREYKYRPSDEKLKQKVTKALKYSGAIPRARPEGSDTVKFATILEDSSKIQSLEQMYVHVLAFKFDYLSDGNEVTNISGFFFQGS